VVGRRTDLGSLLEDRARTIGDAPFLLMSRGVRLTFAEFNRKVNRIAHGLRASGVQRGDPVAVMLPNSVEFLALSYALKKLGAIEVAVNTGFRGAGLAHTLNMTQADLLVADHAFGEPLGAVRDELVHLQKVVVRGERDRVADELRRVEPLAFEEIVANSETDPKREVADTDIATVLFTSGTTGRSKGCTLSHRYAIRQGELISERIGLRADDCLYCPFPLYHVDAAHLTVVPALLLGARAAIGSRFSASRFWEEVREFDATVFDFMGATLTILWKRQPLPEDADNPVRLAWGVPMPIWRDEFEHRFQLELVHAYGLTDGGIPCIEDRSADEPFGSCGKPAYPYDVRIFDDADDEVQPNTVGEIVIRPLEADVMMKGYWGMPEASIEAFRNLWFHTGDLGRIDPDGHLFFEGRKKDAIRRRGENISAYEIEEVLNAHPDVQEAVAVGVPSELTEEEVAAFIVPRASAQIDPEALRNFCRGRMARFMVPKRIELIDAIPKTPTGKPEKYKLVERGVAEVAGAGS